MLKLKVPATTANVGPGFDTIGIALDIYNVLIVTKSSKGQVFTWPTDEVPVSNKNNMILQACHYLLEKHGNTKIAFSIHMETCNIPISRGLGSSAAAIVAGLYAANYLLDNVYSTKDLINFATELEGHPDNVVPAILGGMVISTLENNQVLYSSVSFPETLRFNVMIPDFKLSTAMARDVLPSSYSRDACVLNISRVSMLINALITKDFNKIRPCLKDAVHQPYRLPLIHDSQSIMDTAKSLNALGEFISGAGPTLIALTTADEASFVDKMYDYLNTLDNRWVLHQSKINLLGTITEVVE